MNDEFNSMTYLNKMRTLFYSESIGKWSRRHQRHGIVKLFQFSSMAVLKHRHSSAFLSTEAAHSRRFHFFHNLISSLSQDHTYQSLSSAFWTTVTQVSCFCLTFCIFLPLSVIFQVVLFADTQSHKAFSLAYFNSSLSQYLRK